MVIKAITIRQPWADLIITGTKPIECRTWEPVHFRGPILIHAGKEPDKAAAPGCEGMPKGTRIEPLDAYTYGALLGFAYLSNTFSCRNATPKHFHAWHISGTKAWEMRSPWRFKDPIPFLGQQSIFEIDTSLEGAKGVVLERLAKEYARGQGAPI